MRLAWVVWFVCSIALLSCGIARGEEPLIVDTAWINEKAALFSFRTNGVEDCRIAPDLRIHGDRRAACVEKLEIAARLARAEMRVNEPKRKKR